MTRLFLGFLVSATVLNPVVADANTTSHDFGPHSKAEIATLCSHAHGTLAVSAGKWDRTTARWKIACVDSGKKCVIVLLGTAASATGPSAGGGSTIPASTAPQQGTGLSGNGGAGSVGGKTGGGTTGSVGGLG